MNKDYSKIQFNIRIEKITCETCFQDVLQLGLTNIEYLKNAIDVSRNKELIKSYLDLVKYWDISSLIKKSLEQI